LLKVGNGLAHFGQGGFVFLDGFLICSAGGSFFFKGFLEIL